MGDEKTARICLNFKADPTLRDNKGKIEILFEAFSKIQRLP